MLKAGFTPIPIFTRGADPKELDDMYSVSPLVALGGVQSRAGNSPGYVKWFQQINRSRPIHWLGFTNLDFILQYKPTQVDSTTWKDVLRFGQIDFFVRGRPLRCNKKNFWKFEKQISNLGFNSNDFADPTAWIGDHSLALSLASSAYLKYMQQVREKTGTKIYISVRNPYEMNTVLEQYLKL